MRHWDAKCDENRPKCNNCTKHGIDCIFKPMRTSSPPAILSEASTSSQTALQTPDRNEISSDFSSSHGQASGMNMTELELLHNYSTSTAYTLSRHPVVQSVWRVTVPQI